MSRDYEATWIVCCDSRPRWSAYSPNISLFLYLQLYLYAQLTAHYVPYTGTIFPRSSP